jgi:hypothetical protein
MHVNKRLSGLPGLLLVTACLLIGQSCLPYRGFVRDQPSECLFFITSTKTIAKKCNEGKYDFFVSIKIEGRYDSVKYIDGRPTSFFDIAEYTDSLTFPFSLQPGVLNRNNKIKISIETNSRGASYALSISKEDWMKDTLPFTYFYHR